MDKKVIYLCIGILFCAHVVAKENVDNEGLRFSNSISSEKIYRWEDNREITYGDVRPIVDLKSSNLVIMNLPLSDAERLRREPISEREARQILRDS